MENNNFNHLYIHIPYCKYICTYCDFVRKIPKEKKEIDEYINLLINQINKIKHKLKTIYIGGGTPNFLSNDNLTKLLLSLNKNIDLETEFTIECNPDFVNEVQVRIFKKYKVNRISLGVQTTNNNILKLINRKHLIEDAKKSISILKKHNITNISCDFIYNLPLLTKNDLKNSIQFCLENNIKHISFYSLEIKEGSIMNKMKHKINKDNEEDQLEFIINELKKTNFKRYEVSNWSLHNKFQSKHNLSYWKMKNWRGIGYGSYGLESLDYYYIKGNYLEHKKESNILSKKEFYQYILIMGLRLIDGIDLRDKNNNNAYLFFKEKLNHNLLEIKNNFLKAKNVNLLDEILIDII